MATKATGRIVSRCRDRGIWRERDWLQVFILTGIGFHAGGWSHLAWVIDGGCRFSFDYHLIAWWRVLKGVGLDEVGEGYTDGYTWGFMGIYVGYILGWVYGWCIGFVEAWRVVLGGFSLVYRVCIYVTINSHFTS